MSKDVLALWLVLSLAIFTGAARAIDSLAEKYKRWLEDEVSYIIADQERKEFLSLGTNAERDAFVEKFWSIRDTDTSTERNEYREAHYARIADANAKFHDGKPGWRTERGRVYIRHGPPDNISFNFGGGPIYIDIVNPTAVIMEDDNPDRRRQSRLSFTTPETEIWVYRSIDGAENFTSYFQVIFSRIDPMQLYQLNQTLQRLGPGPNLSYAQRVERDLAVTNFLRGQRIGGEFRVLYAGEYRFHDIDQFYQSIFHPSRLPTVSVSDLQLGLEDLERSPGEALHRRLDLGRRLKERVESRVFFDRIPLSVSFGSIQADTGGTILPLTLGLQTGAAKDTIDLLAELIRSDGKPAARLIETLKIDPKEEQLVYHGRLAATPGTYQLQIYAGLRENAAIAHFSREVHLPDYSHDGLDISDLLFFQKVMPRKNSREKPSSALYLKDYILVPSAEPRFRRAQKLTVFFEVYNPGLSKNPGEPALQVNCRFLQNGRLIASVPQKFLDHVRETKSSGIEIKRTAYGLSIPLHSFQPGEYSLEVEVSDEILGGRVSKNATFEIF